MGFSSVAATVASIVVGGAVAAATIVGVVASQTGVDGASPANVNQPVVEYGESE